MAASLLLVFRQHFPSLCRIIGSHPDTCLLTATELYSKDLISREVKNDVTERARAANVEDFASMLGSQASRVTRVVEDGSRGFIYNGWSKTNHRKDERRNTEILSFSKH